jgi:hypothetical protein
MDRIRAIRMAAYLMLRRKMQGIPQLWSQPWSGCDLPAGAIA